MHFYVHGKYVSVCVPQRVWFRERTPSLRRMPTCLQSWRSTETALRAWVQLQSWCLGGSGGDGDRRRTASRRCVDGRRPMPWWQVDLGNFYHVVAVELFTRTDLDCQLDSSCGCQYFNSWKNNVGLNSAMRLTWWLTKLGCRHPSGCQTQI